MRASSLSNLGELCQQLDFSLGPLAQEVVDLKQLKDKSSSEADEMLNLSFCMHGLNCN